MDGFCLRVDNCVRSASINTRQVPFGHE
jgi:hypothetical protein